MIKFSDRWQQLSSPLFHIFTYNSDSMIICFQEGISDILEDVTNRFMFGDWRLLHILAYNMNPMILAEFIEELHNQMREKDDITLPRNDSNANLRRPLLTPI